MCCQSFHGSHLNLKRLGAALIAEKFEWRIRLTVMSVRKYVNEDG